MLAWTLWGTRNYKQPAGMVRTPCVDKNGLRKGTWTAEEDQRLIAYVARYGHWNWRQLPRFAGLARSGKSCRLRWLNYLRPNIKRGNFTQEEDETIVKLVHHLGYRWSAIASQLPGRTDNEIKNYWRTNLQKQFQQNSTIHEEAQVSNSRHHSLIEPTPNNIIGPFQSLPPTSQSNVTLSPSSEFFTATNLITATANNKNLVLENEFAFLDAFKEPMSEFFWLDDTAIGPIMPNNNIIDPFQILPSTSQSIDSCPTSIPSSWSELSIITDHTTVASMNNLVPEDEFDFQDALIEKPMSGIFLLDDSPIDPLPNSMMDAFQILASSQSTNYCPTSTHSSSSEFSITTNNNITVVSDKNLIPENEFAFVNSYEEPMIRNFSLDYSLVEPMPNCPNNITCPLQSLPTTSRSPYSCPFQSSRELFVSAHDENVLVE